MSDIRCRWCGSRAFSRTPPSIQMPCRARLAGNCEKWESGMPKWVQFIELDEYVDEVTFVKHKRKRK